MHPSDKSTCSSVCLGNVVSKKLFCKPCLFLCIFSDVFQKQGFFKNRHSCLASLEPEHSRLADKNINNKMNLLM